MGRPSKLTEAQWEEVRKRVLDGQSIRKVAKDFGVSEAAVRGKVSAQVTEIKSVANQIVAADSALKALPVSAQVATITLAQKLANVSMQIGSAAEYAAANAHRLMGMAHMKIAEIDDATPLGEESRQVLKDVAVVTALANESSKIPLNLLAANKEAFAAPADPEDINQHRYIVAPDVAESNEAWEKEAQSHRSK